MRTQIPSELIGAYNDLCAAVASYRQSPEWRAVTLARALASRVRRQPDIDLLQPVERAVKALGDALAAHRLTMPQVWSRHQEIGRQIAHLRSSRLYQLLKRPPLERLIAVRRGTRLLGPGGLVEAYEHCDRLGRDELARLRAATDPSIDLLALPATQWPLNPRQTTGADAHVDVAVPVYGGLVETLACLYSVMAARVETAFELVVINDASPLPELVAKLDELAAAGRITLLTNAVNGGFVVTANRGLKHSARRDVVLLNSDTEVYDGWLDRLRRTCHSAPDVGTTTPMSNDATIFSYPHINVRNFVPYEISGAELASVAAAANDGASFAVPTAMGFCMYIRRDCLDDVGLLDEAKFGRGYGEESDFCMRAHKKGWVHLGAPDTYVFHKGSVSFGSEVPERLRHAHEVLDRLHPEYKWLVHEHVERNPAFPFRRRIDIGRLARVASKRAGVLHVLHNWGGGTQQHVDALARTLAEEEIPNFILSPSERDNGVVTLYSPQADETPNAVFRLYGDWEELIDALSRINIGHVHYHHILGMSDVITTLPERLGVSYDVTLHDYYYVCPQINLMNAENRYCGEPDAVSCNRCVRAKPPLAGGGLWVGGWRDGHRRFLSGARRVLAPDADVAERYARYFPDLPYLVRPHFDDAVETVAQRPQTLPGGERRILVLGAINSSHKGVEVLRACAKDAAARNLPLRFVVVGYTSYDHELKELSSVQLHGKYSPSILRDMIANAAPHLALLPSIWPETYSYTLSECIANSVQPVVFDIGAMARRVRALGWGAILPLELTPSAINDRLLAVELAPPPPDLAARAFHPFPGALAYYDGLPSLAATDTVEQSLV